MTNSARLQLFKESFHEFVEDDASSLAAALSYYTLFAVTPLLIIAIAISAFVFGERAARGEIFGQLHSLVGAPAADAMQSMIRSAATTKNRGIWASVFSVVLLLIGASNVVAHLKGSLDAMWCVSKKEASGFMAAAKERLWQVSVVLVVGALLLGLLLVSIGLSALSDLFDRTMPLGSWFWQVLNMLVSIAVVTGLFGLIYRFLPDEEIGWRDVWTGAAFTAVLFTLGKMGMGWYLARGSVTSSYGAAGSLVVLILWLYYSSLIFFFGAEFTEVYARRARGSLSRKARRSSRASRGLSGERQVSGTVAVATGRGKGRRTLVPALAAGAGGLLAGLVMGVAGTVLALLRTGLRIFRN
ncbi:MAG: YihY/virulence factor BrkB family protein [Acidobacteriota bacterium]